MSLHIMWCRWVIINNMAASIQSFSSGALPPNCLILFSGIICKAGHHLPYYAAKVLMPFLNLLLLGQDVRNVTLPCNCCAFVALTRFVMAGSSITTTTTTKSPRSISIRQPPMCLNVVDPSDHPPNNHFSYQPSLFNLHNIAETRSASSPHSRFIALITVLLTFLETYSYIFQ